jgi:hypothetical protein
MPVVEEAVLSGGCHILLWAARHRSLQAWPWLRASSGPDGLGGPEFLAMVAGEHGGGSGVAAEDGSSAACRAWLPWRGLRRPGDSLVMRLAEGVTLTAADPASTAARSCLVVVGGSSALLPHSGSCFGVGRGGGQLVDESVVCGGLVFHR